MLSFIEVDSCQFLFFLPIFVQIFEQVEDFTSINRKSGVQHFLFQSQEFFQEQRAENFSKLLSS